MQIIGPAACQSILLHWIASGSPSDPPQQPASHLPLLLLSWQAGVHNRHDAAKHAAALRNLHIQAALALRHGAAHQSLHCTGCTSCTANASFLPGAACFCQPTIPNQPPQQSTPGRRPRLACRCHCRQVRQHLQEQALVGCLPAGAPAAVSRLSYQEQSQRATMRHQLGPR